MLSPLRYTCATGIFVLFRPFFVRNCTLRGRLISNFAVLLESNIIRIQIKYGKLFIKR